MNVAVLSKALTFAPVFVVHIWISLPVDFPTTVSPHCFCLHPTIHAYQFYFGDSNLTKPDKFLVGLIKSGTQGYVDLGVIAKFKRMEELIPTKDVQILAAALRTSANPLLDISEDGTLVRRSPSCPLPKENLYNKRTIYSKGWDLETTDERPIAKFFADKGYEVLSVRLRKALHTHEFKGSAFVEFKDVDSAMKAAGEDFELEGDKKLEVEMKEVYHARKKAVRAEEKAKKRAASGEDGTCWCDAFSNLFLCCERQRSFRLRVWLRHVTAAMIKNMLRTPSEVLPLMFTQVIV
jgi:hypothetical protein